MNNSVTSVGTIYTAAKKTQTKKVWQQIKNYPENRTSAIFKRLSSSSCAHFDPDNPVFGSRMSLSGRAGPARSPVCLAASMGLTAELYGCLKGLGFNFNLLQRIGREELSLSFIIKTYVVVFTPSRYQ